ncbi:interleukin-22 receptor subunit alpha-2 [Periophthalmus magnuspinnatus]|uniref:interleukin-22 receptor subunit alpha-2 n=1 Tax=Periophthalmus magnuspinnatus TaxID=409849 RepID=UPI002436FC7D|nr:interleukin-22 receptor subunit alpha-2 [Periophthalmus magnuspinnatus]
MINMRAVLWAAVLLGTVGGGLTEQVSLLPPAHLRFDSVDYKTTAVWIPPSNSSTLLYNVQWKIYGEPEWLNVDHCQGIEKPKCDLSEETSDVTEWYYARVQATTPAAKSPWVTSRRFSPRWDSEISPPLLRLNTTMKGIVARVKPPRAQVRKQHRDLFYKIYLIRENGEEEEFEMNCCFHKLCIKDVKRKARYCFQAQTILPLQARSSARSEVKCITVR